MSRATTATFIRECQAHETSEVYLVLFRLSHPSWASDRLYVRNGEAIVHNAETYLPFGFDVALPDETDTGLPVLRFVSDNVQRELIEGLRTVEDSVQVQVSLVLASEPDSLLAGPIEAIIQGAEADLETLTGVFAVEPVLDEAFSKLAMDSQNTPGIF